MNKLRPMAKAKRPAALPRHLDLSTLVNKKKNDLEAKILNQAIDQYLHTSGKEYEQGQLTVDNERVKNYGRAILTYRYDDAIMLRCFPMDLEGLKWMYQSPVFGDTFE